MTEQDDKPRANRDRKGRFARGNQASKGHGRPSKSRERIRKLAEAASDDQVEQVLEALRLEALHGETTAAQLWLSYTLGRPRVAAHFIETDAIGDEVKTAEQAFAVLGRVLVQMGAGKLDVESARVVLSSVGEFAKGLQLIDLQRELEQLRAEVDRVTGGGAA